MNLNDLVSVLLVPLGIGLVIFVHELGHFLAARWCGARVEVFSLGFGAKLFGWKRGDTLFQVAAIPLGGYVKVAGEYFDGSGDREEGTLSSLNVGQRFLYYSGGVIMNVLFALVALPLVMFAGLPTEAPITGEPRPAWPAWEAGVPAGARVLAVNGEEITDFQHLITAVAVNGKEPLDVLADVDGAERHFRVVPRWDEENGLYRIGVPPGMDPARRLVVVPDSPATRAGLGADDRVLSVVGGIPGVSIERQLVRAMERREPLALRVEGANGEVREVLVTPDVDPAGPPRIGITASLNLLEAVRTTGPAAPLVEALGLASGDRVVAACGHPVFGPRDLEDALAPLGVGDEVTLDLLRAGARERATAVVPEGVDPAALVDDLALAVPEDGGTIDVVPGSPAEAAGLASGDEIISIDGRAVGSWDEILETIRAAVAAGATMEILAYRGDADAATGKRAEVTVRVAGAPTPVAEYGLTLAGARVVLKAETLGQAITWGARATQRFLADVWNQLRKMVFTDELSSKNLGGVISIGVISFETASQGLSKFFFFLAILSINLAIINLLPIPILDGGHLLFLVIEAIKGSPVSERTFGYSQVVGLVMIMSLMVYVTFQDIMRWIVGG